mmetsp:Transcript_34711/g.73905  ORF Transcript_34711/g.73905 Transcript_34711/m.73905 type:complete len:84 (+) Transcript_34711:137-388(+)
MPISASRSMQRTRPQKRRCGGGRLAMGSAANTERETHTEKKEKKRKGKEQTEKKDGHANRALQVASLAYLRENKHRARCPAFG